MSVTLNLARDVLGRRLLDSDSDACGRVDDIEVAFDGKSLQVTHLLTGPGVVAARMPRRLASIYRRFAGSRVTRIAWSDVLCISGMVHLRKTARQLGLGRRAPSGNRAAEASR